MLAEWNGLLKASNGCTPIISIIPVPASVTNAFDCMTLCKNIELYKNYLKIY